MNEKIIGKNGERVENLLELKGVSKRFSRTIFEDISFSLKSGEVVGIFGNNGAGKTTLLKICSGIISPTKGEVFVLGKRAVSRKDFSRVRIFFIGDEYGIYDHLKIFENFYFWSSLFGVKPTFEDIKSSLQFFGVSEYLYYFGSEVSRGTQKKIALSIAKIVNPKILIIDEIFANLDGYGREKILEFISDFLNFGAVIFSSPVKYDLKLKIVEINL